jgi:hypothetical protein
MRAALALHCASMRSYAQLRSCADVSRQSIKLMMMQ